jgi:carbamate kinase
MVNKLAVIAVGGNSLIEDPTQPDIPHQWDAVRQTSEHIAEIIASGWSVVITHGNGPQVGFILRRGEIAAQQGIHDVPLDLIVADTQGSIGYMLQQTLDNALRRQRINRTIISVVTQVLVDNEDTDFANPTKPIGGFMDQAQARLYQEEGWNVMEDAGRGWRRVVASPKPLAILEINAIKSLKMSNYVVITCGGGGIPVIRNAHGSLRGVAAVVDKDRASSLLARELRADAFLISTGVEKVALNFGQPNRQDLDHLTLAEAQRYLLEGQFPAGSMRPKIEAVVDFVQSGGPYAVITNPPNLLAALEGKAGTQILPG